MEKAILDEFGQAVHDLRTHATEASDAVKALGGKFTLYDEKASKISDRLDKLEGTIATNAYTDQIADIRKNFADSLEELEAKISRIHGGGGGRNVAQKSVHQAAFTKMVRKGVSHEAMHHASFLNADEVKALTVGNDVGGGYLAPPEFVQQLIDENIVEISPLRGLINVRPTVRGSIMMPTITGHASAKWVDETGDRAETQNPKFGSKEIRTNEQYAMVKVSRMDLEDSVFDVEAMLRQEFGMQFGLSLIHI